MIRSGVEVAASIKQHPFQVLAIEPIRNAIDAKLGRCAKCIRLSIGLSITCWIVLVSLLAAGAPTPFIVAISAPTTAFSALLLAHGIAYFIRDRASVSNCTPCAAKARARRRKARTQFIHSFFRRQKLIGSRTSPSCKSCHKALSSEQLLEIADDLPRADQGLRTVVESSAEFEALYHRLASIEPTDSWRVDVRNHFVYPLKRETDGEGATALFITRWEDYGVLSAVTVHPEPNGGNPRIVHLRV